VYLKDFLRSNSGCSCAVPVTLAIFLSGNKKRGKNYIRCAG